MSNLSQFFAGGEPPYWVSGSTYAQGRIVRSPADQQVFVRIVAGAGTTDPSADATNWRAEGMRAIKSIQRGVISIASSVLTGTATITSVNPVKTELRMLGSVTSAASVLNEGTGHVVLTNATTVTATRQFNGATTLGISWELTEYF